jgi:hypothetical protein
MESPITYKPVGRCIYCGASGGKLTREHIIPFGLGGSWVLPDASCKVCAAITAKVEQFCLRPMLGRFRIQMKLPTRRPGERPDALPLEIVRADGSLDSKPLPIEEHPITASVDWAAPASLMANHQAFEGRLIVRYAGTDRNFLKHAKGEADGLSLALSARHFARMLARSVIRTQYQYAHSFTDAGQSKATTPIFMPPIWLGDKRMMPKSACSSVYLQDCTSGGVIYTLAGITLFEIVGMPRYHVIVGRKLGPPAGIPIPSQ